MERKSYLCKVKRGNEDERENNFLRKEIEGGGIVVGEKKEKERRERI